MTTYQAQYTLPPQQQQQQQPLFTNPNPATPPLLPGQPQQQPPQLQPQQMGAIGQQQQQPVMMVMNNQQLQHPQPQAQPQQQDAQTLAHQLAVQQQQLQLQQKHILEQQQLLAQQQLQIANLNNTAGAVPLASAQPFSLQQSLQAASLQQQQQQQPQQPNVLPTTVQSQPQPVGGAMQPTLFTPQPQPGQPQQPQQIPLQQQQPFAQGVAQQGAQSPTILAANLPPQQLPYSPAPNAPGMVGQPMVQPGGTPPGTMAAYLPAYSGAAVGGYAQPSPFILPGPGGASISRASSSVGTSKSSKSPSNSRVTKAAGGKSAKKKKTAKDDGDVCAIPHTPVEDPLTIKDWREMKWLTAMAEVIDTTGLAEPCDPGAVPEVFKNASVATGNGDKGQMSSGSVNSSGAFGEASSSGAVTTTLLNLSPAKAPADPLPTEEADDDDDEDPEDYLLANFSKNYQNSLSLGDASQGTGATTNHASVSFEVYESSSSAVGGSPTFADLTTSIDTSASEPPPGSVFYECLIGKVAYHPLPHKNLLARYVVPGQSPAFHLLRKMETANGLFFGQLKYEMRASVLFWLIYVVSEKKVMPLHIHAKGPGCFMTYYANAEDVATMEALSGHALIDYEGLWVARSEEEVALIKEATQTTTFNRRSKVPKDAIVIRH